MKTGGWGPHAASTTLLALVAAAQAFGQWIPTNVGNGADAEIRESSPTTNRGSSTELATRILDTGAPPGDTSDRNSLMFMRFDLSATPIPASFETAFRLTYRNNSLTEARIQDSITPDPSVRTGLSIYGLDPMAAGANWNESTITYLNAPGITPDGDVGTRDLNGDLIFLGAVMFPEIGTQNWLPVGGALVFQSPQLDQFVADALGAGATEVTLVSHAAHDGTTPFGAWLNFNYLFNPKEQTTLNADPNYDSDVADPTNPLGSPWSAADNSTGEFSPSLLIQDVGLPTVEIPVMSQSGIAVLIGLIAIAGFLFLRARSS